MSGVNVLAVMDEMIDCYVSVEECPDDTLFLKDAREARAAVAELIEAAQGTLRLTGAYGTASVPSISLDPLRNALSRIGG